jgi:glyoxylase-like metal-dependent hydrolase (beta-lactamase superfamily II)
MAEVKILVEGYARKVDGHELASSTATLIKEKGINVVVDPGMDREVLLSVLQKENLETGDIDFVFLTHYHLDHSLLAGIFENAKILDNSEMYSWDGRIESHGGKIPGTDIEIIQTPGHSPSHASVVVEDDKGETIVVAGDVVWWWDHDEQNTDHKSLTEQVHKELPHEDFEKLRDSRRHILEIADWIVPGHGKMFKVKK